MKDTNLMQAHYSEAILLEVLKKEQDRITNDVEAAEERLKILSVKQEIIQKCIDIALVLASHCYDAYQKARPKHRQLFNQAFFRKIYVKNKKVSGFEYTEAFDFLLNKDKDEPDESGSNKNGLVPPDRFERSTYRLGGGRSILLSYEGTSLGYSETLTPATSLRAGLLTWTETVIARSVSDEAISPKQLPVRLPRPDKPALSLSKGRGSHV